MPHWEDLMSIYKPESNVYVAIAQESDRTGAHGSGWDLYEYLNQSQGVILGPSVWYGDPGKLQRYVWQEDTATLLAFAKQHLGPPNPGPAPPGPSPPTPPPAPTPPTPPSPNSSYAIADQKYFCPLDYFPIHSHADCKAATAALSSLPSWLAVRNESDHADPPGCWVYGTLPTYSAIWLNPDGSTDQKQYRPQRSAVCKKKSLSIVV